MSAKRFAIFSIILFLFYTIAIYLYIFKFANSTLPIQLKGTTADPASFLTGNELLLSEQYSKVRNFLFFISTPFEWLVYLFVLIAGLSTLFQNWAKNTVKYNHLKTLVYLFWFSLFTFLCAYPLSYLRYNLAKKYGISVQSFSAWMKNELIDFWISFALLTVIVIVLYYLIRRTKNWWFYGWLLSVPFTLFLMFIQPVLIDPLYNDFYPLKNKELEEKILTLAAEANIPAEHVFEVNKSAETNALNAYVTGIGKNARIVLWDTTLERLDDDEILFVMAHEMAHYTKKHLYRGIGISMILTFIGLYLTNKISLILIKKYRNLLQITTLKEIRSLPLILVILSMLSFTVSPFSNFVSRQQEIEADRYALELTGDHDAAVSTFQKLTKASLNEVKPPLLVKIFRYGHPTMLERITMIEHSRMTDED